MFIINNWISPIISDEIEHIIYQTMQRDGIVNITNRGRQTLIISIIIVNKNKNKNKNNNTTASLLTKTLIINTTPNGTQTNRLGLMVFED